MIPEGMEIGTANPVEDMEIRQATPAEIEEDDGGVQGARELLYRGAWRREAAQIPLDSVEDEDEKKVIIKCINQDEVNPLEMEILQQVLHRYRKAIREQKPFETIENYEDNVAYVEDEKAFLAILDDEEQNQELTVHYPLMGGREAVLPLVVEPLTDAQAVIEVTENLQIFNDYTAEETQAFVDYQNGKSQTPEERAIAKEIEVTLARKQSNRVKDAAIEFLAIQTKFKGKNSSRDDMRQIYKRMNVGILLLIFARVKEMLYLGDVDVDKIFR